MGGVALTRQMMIVDEGFSSLFNDCHFKSAAVPGKKKEENIGAAVNAAGLM